MIKMTIFFDTRFHTVNGKQDFVSFSVDSFEKARAIVHNCNKMGNVSDIRIDYCKDGIFHSEYFFCMEMFEKNQLVKRVFCTGKNGNSFSDDEMETISDMVDDWEKSDGCCVFFKNNYNWIF